MSAKQSFIEDDEAVRQAYISAPIGQDDLDGLRHVLDEARATDDEMAPVCITQEGAEKLLRQLPPLLAAAKRCAEMEAALEEIAQWSRAYPCRLFPSLQQFKRLLESRLQAASGHRKETP